MTQYITREEIEAAGVSVPEVDGEAFVEHVSTTLAERIGAEITESLSDEEVDAMVSVQESGDETAFQAWLIENVPELNEIVQDERTILLGELATENSQ